MDNNNNNQNFESMMLFYERCCEDWRHYDTQIWQVTNITFVVNGFLIVLAFNQTIDIKVKVFIPLMAGLFTITLLIALIKHRLHQDIRSINIRKLERKLNENKDQRIVFYDFSKDSFDLEEIGEKNTLFFRVFKKAKAFNIICWMFTLIFLCDIMISIGFMLRWW
ncbi:MAG: hypothetical protein VB013_10695 [Anaerolineaceae bacterium]|nr:hypothetical protein [Anaerolineaceae bacterium]